MNKSLLSKITTYLSNQKIKSRRQKVFMGLAMVVVFCTVYALMMPAITMGETLICTKEEHIHTIDCYEEKLICEADSENINDESCYEKVLIYEHEEHTHTNNCYVTDTELESINNLIQVIDTLPTYEEFNNKVTELELTSKEEADIYKEDIVSKAQSAYNTYYKMTEKEKTQITNIDKLIAYVDNDLITEPLEEETELETPSISLFGLTQNNVKKPTTTTSADTYDIIKVNLYNYGISINDPYNADSKYPGFQQDGGTKLTSSSTSLAQWNYNFGNNITAEIADIKSGVTKDKTNINQVITNENGSMIPLTEEIKTTIGEDGYPALITGESLGYLFGAPFNYSNNSNVASLNGITYATKQNNDNINGLFKQNETTGAYYYDSRINHAQYSNNTFTLYNEKITSNYIMYPFGNFLPFNNINNDTTYVNRYDTATGQYIYGIDRTRLQEIAESAEEKSTKDNDVYDKLSVSLTNFIRLMDAKLGSTTWNALDTVNDYFRKSGIIEETASVDPSILSNLYSIDYDVATDFFFGLDMEMDFIQPKNGLTGKDGKQEMIFDFNGDDDVWVFIDNVLFLDLTGIHRHVGGKIDFVNGLVYYYDLDKSSGEISETAYITKTFAKILEEGGYTQDQIKEALIQTGTDDSGNPIYGTFKNYSTHNFKFYYMERGAGSGVMKMNFNMPLLKENSISVTKELSVDEGTVSSLGNPDFMFQILSVDSSGNKTNTPYIKEGTTYEIYEKYDTDRILVGTGLVGEDGIFKLKKGQTAVFSGIEEDSGKYYVRELLDTDWASQYKDVIIDGSSSTTENDITISKETFKGYESSIKDISDGSTVFIFNNNVDTYEYGSLGIKKEVSSYQENFISRPFTFDVTLGGIALPIGTTYTVTSSTGITTKTVETAGKIIIYPGETALIEGIIAGSTYKVVEELATNSGYTVIYNGDKELTSAEGIILPNQNTDGEEESTDPSVSITVTNKEYGESLSIPIIKNINNPEKNDNDEEVKYTYNFKLVEVTDSTGNTEVSTTNVLTQNAVANLLEQNTSTKTILNNSINLYDQGNNLFTLLYTQSDYKVGTTVHYYKIVEVPNDQDEYTDYDETKYVIEVSVTSKIADTLEDSFEVSITKIWKDDILIWEKTEESSTPPTQTFTFTNTLLSKLSISKTVEGEGDINKEFEFEITLQNENDSLLKDTYTYHRKTADSDTSTIGNLDFSNNRTTKIKIKHNETITIDDIPSGTKYIIKELDTEGYVVKHNIISGEIDLGTTLGDTTETITLKTGGDNSVSYINASGHELPATGSSGMLILIIIGSLLLIVPVIYIGYIILKRERKVS